MCVGYILCSCTNDINARCLVCQILVRHFPVPHFPVLHFQAKLVIWSVIFRSCIFSWPLRTNWSFLEFWSGSRKLMYRHLDWSRCMDTHPKSDQHQILVSLLEGHSLPMHSAYQVCSTSIVAFVISDRCMDTQGDHHTNACSARGACM